MAKPIVAIVGRPNVGKSTLYNRIAGRKSAIVEDLPGVTRDRNYEDVQWEDKSFTIVDTGGFEPDSKDRMLTLMRNQATLAVEESDCIIFLMDGQQGLIPSDIEVADRLRKSGKPILYAVNKIDGPKHESNLPEFTHLGIDTIYSISALHGQGFYDLMEGLYSLLPQTVPEESMDYPKIAIVGRPNVGKSSLLNSLLGKERVIVDSVAGTTRDSIDSFCSYYGHKFLLIDTAGIRKKGRISQQIERYSTLRAMKAIERCDVALILLDSKEGPTEQDVKIAALTYEAGKGAVIVLNKWDLIKKDELTLENYKKFVKRKMPFVDYAPVIAISAVTRQRTTKIFGIIKNIIEERRKRIQTSTLNDVVKKIITRQPPHRHRGKEIKIYYLTQVSTEPPTFTLFTNYPEGISPQYLRYIEKGLRRAFGFEGTPMRIFIRGKRNRRN